MKGEIWKDVPGYEGYYKVSNLGRVRSSDRVVPHPRWGTQWVKGRVLRQDITKRHNRYVGDDIVSLRVELNQDGIASRHLVRRLVYHAFVKKIDFGKDGMCVINKDNNGYNNHVSNLELATRATVEQRTRKTGRQNFDWLKTVDRSGWKKNYPQTRPVNQYTTRGRLVRKYKSLTEAHLVTGFHISTISKAAKGVRKHCGGYKWKFPGQKIRKRP